MSDFERLMKGTQTVEAKAAESHGFHLKADQDRAKLAEHVVRFTQLFDTLVAMVPTMQEINKRRQAAADTAHSKSEEMQVAVTEAGFGTGHNPTSFAIKDSAKYLVGTDEEYKKVVSETDQHLEELRTALEFIRALDEPLGTVLNDIQEDVSYQESLHNDRMEGHAQVTEGITDYRRLYGPESAQSD